MPTHAITEAETNMLANNRQSMARTGFNIGTFCDNRLRLWTSGLAVCDEPPHIPILRVETAHGKEGGTRGNCHYCSDKVYETLCSDEIPFRAGGTASLPRPTVAAVSGRGVAALSIPQPEEVWLRYKGASYGAISRMRA